MTLVGIESLLALKQACRTLNLNDTDIERIFSTNATELLGISPIPPATDGTGQVLYLKAKTLIPGGTQLVSKRPEQYALRPDKWPAYFSEARGCEVVDLDGRHYLDFATSGIGTCLLGYANPVVTGAVLRRVQLGSMCTLNSPEEVELAELLLGMHTLGSENTGLRAKRRWAGCRRASRASRHTQKTSLLSVDITAGLTGIWPPISATAMH